MSEQEIITIKVEEKPEHCYFVRFDRETHALIDVRELKQIYVPTMGVMSNRIGFVVDLATGRIDTPHQKKGH